MRRAMLYLQSVVSVFEMKNFNEQKEAFIMEDCKNWWLFGASNLVVRTLVVLA